MNTSRYPLLDELEVILITDSSQLVDNVMYMSYQNDLIAKFGCKKIYELDINDTSQDVADCQTFVEKFNKVGLCITIFFPPSTASRQKLVNDFKIYNIITTDLMIPIVDHQWIDDVIRQGKILKTARSAINPEYFLKDCNIFVDTHEFNEMEMHILQLIINNFGGTLILKDYRTSLLTHIVTSEPAMYTDAHARVVKTTPEWLMMCLLNNTRMSTKVDYSNVLLKAQVSTEVSSSTLRGKNFVVSNSYSESFSKNGFDFAIFLRLFIKKYGGTVQEDMDSEILVNKSLKTIEHFSDPLFAKISQQHRCNLWWLLDTINYKGDPNGLMIKKLLHYPYNKLSLSVPSPTLMSFTNFIGVQRFYIQQLMKFLSIPYTLDFSLKNTGLIYFYRSGSKYKYAKAQNITCLDHTYLEYCYKFKRFIDYNTFKSNFDNDFMKNEYFGLIGSTFEEKNVDELDSLNHYGVSNSEYDDAFVVEDDDIDNIDNMHISAVQQVGSQGKTEENGKKNLEISQINLSSITEGLVSDNLDTNGSSKSRKTSQFFPVQSQSKSKPEFDITKETAYKSPSFELNNKQISQKSDMLEAELNRQELSVDTGDIYQAAAPLDITETSPLPSSPIEPLDEHIVTEQQTALLPDEPHGDVTPVVSQIDHSQRRAKQKAVRKVSTSIEELNVYARVAKKRKIDEDELRIPISIKSDQSVLHISQTSANNNNNNNNNNDGGESDEDVPAEIIRNIEQAIFEDDNPNKTILPSGTPMFCIITGCRIEDYLNPKNLELDLRILSKVGIVILNKSAEIEDDNYAMANCLIAPKKMRTEKFLKSLCLRKLRYVILPQFLAKVLDVLKEGNTLRIPKLDEFSIPDMNFESLLNQIETRLDNGFVTSGSESGVLASASTRLFAQYGINTMNIVNNINGGIQVISSILTAHGISQINEFNDRSKTIDVEKDFSINVEMKNQESTPSSSGTPFFDYIFLVNKTSQANNILKNLRKNGIIPSGKTKKQDQLEQEYSKVLIVEWNWCVKCIFGLRVDFEDPDHVVYMH